MKLSLVNRHNLINEFHERRSRRNFEIIKFQVEGQFVLKGFRSRLVLMFIANQEKMEVDIACIFPFYININFIENHICK